MALAHSERAVLNCTWSSGKASGASFSEPWRASQACHSATSAGAYRPRQTPTPCISTKAAVALAAGGAPAYEWRQMWAGLWMLWHFLRNEAISG